MLAIEPEPKSLEPATAPKAQHQTTQNCCQLRVLYDICAHFCHVYVPHPPQIFMGLDDKALKLVFSLMAVFTIYLLKNIIITIYT